MDNEEKKSNLTLPAAFVIASIVIGGAIVYSAGIRNSDGPKKVAGENKIDSVIDLQEKVIPSGGVELPVKWGNLGKQLVNSGVIDANQLEAVYKDRGELGDEEKKLLYDENNENIIINSKNSGYILNMFWALGLANKNQVLENGPMVDPQYGGAGGFASTGGWTISKGDAMNYYSKYPIIVLNPEQQALVEKVAKNIYRPCCGNSTYFPDCNHGMAMLGLLELAASQGVGESDMYKMALIVNSYWFPETYMAIGQYFENRGVAWEKVDAKEVLGANFSSAQGYQRIQNEVNPPDVKSGGSGGCGV